jgi:hypothetical protein
MTPRTIQGVFEREEDMLRAAESAAKAGWTIVDIYTPYPVHEAFHLLRLGRSRLPMAAFVCGLVGVLAALWFQFWVSARDWPLNVGGRPWNSWPAFVPVTFEMMVLCAGLGVVLAWLVVCGLYPGKEANVPAPKVTDNRFVLQVQEPMPYTDADVIHRVFRECNVCDLEERGTP